MDINDKVARCRILATLVVADDFVEEAELEFLERAMGRLGLSEEEKTQVMVLMDQDAALEALDSLTHSERVEFLDDLAAVCWVDGDLDDYEVEQLRVVCDALGLDEGQMKSALARAQDAAGF